MSSKKDVLLSVMTWNIYLGADLTPIFTANPKDLNEIKQRVTEVFRQFLATNFLKRAKAIARQIILEKPDIIGLQEAVLVELLPIQDPHLPSVVYDFVDILLNELADKGMHYTIAAHHDGTPSQLPSSTGNTIRFTDRDVILVRKGIVNVINSQNGNFVNNVTNPLTGSPILRGWSAIDAYVQGKKYRIVNTHLEPLDSYVQIAQGNELLNKFGQTRLPLIFIGDFNSNANPNSSGTPTYGNIIANGFQDTWLIAGNTDGSTALQDADLLNLNNSLNERIDFILIKNMSNWIVNDVLVGEAQSDRTSTRLWPSDHVGVIAKFKLESCSDHHGVI